MNRAALVILALLGFASLAYAKNLDKDFNSLGDNAAIVERAQSLDPKNKVQVVQNRLVDRNSRLELGVNYGIVSGGDSYLSSQNFGGNMDFHITPRWSLGLRYEHYINSFTSEGKAVFTDANMHVTSGDTNWRIPQTDAPSDLGLFVVNWYPIYGKLNLFSSIVHFDIYTLLGFGETVLVSGNSNTFAAGGGFGIWLTQWLASRIEIRYQTYEDHVYSGNRRIDSVVPTMSLGILL